MVIKILLTTVRFKTTLCIEISKKSLILIDIMINQRKQYILLNKGLWYIIWFREVLDTMLCASDDFKVTDFISLLILKDFWSFKIFLEINSN